MVTDHDPNINPSSVHNLSKMGNPHLSFPSGKVYSPPHRKTMNKIRNNSSKDDTSSLITHKQKKIVIKNDLVSRTQKLCAEYGLLCRWTGIGASVEKVMKWVTTQLNNEVCISILQEKFLYIDCSSKLLKAKLIVEGLPKFRNIGFHTFDWTPFFDPSKLNNFLVEKVIKLCNLPIELSDVDYLREIVNDIGKFVGFIDLERSWAEKFIIVHMELNEFLDSPLEVCCETRSVYIYPKIIDGDFVDVENIGEELESVANSQIEFKSQVGGLSPPIPKNQNIFNKSTKKDSREVLLLNQDNSERLNQAGSSKTRIHKNNTLNSDCLSSFLEEGEICVYPKVPPFLEPIPVISFMKNLGGFCLNDYSPQLDKDKETWNNSPIPVNASLDPSSATNSIVVLKPIATEDPNQITQMQKSSKAISQETIIISPQDTIHTPKSVYIPNLAFNNTLTSEGGLIDFSLQSDDEISTTQKKLIDGRTS